MAHTITPPEFERMMHSSFSGKSKMIIVADDGTEYILEGFVTNVTYESSAPYEPYAFFPPKMEVSFTASGPITCKYSGPTYLPGTPMPPKSVGEEVREKMMRLFSPPGEPLKTFSMPGSEEMVAKIELDKKERTIDEKKAAEESYYKMIEMAKAMGVSETDYLKGKTFPGELELSEKEYKWSGHELMLEREAAEKVKEYAKRMRGEEFTLKLEGVEEPLKVRSRFIAEVPDPDGGEIVAQTSFDEAVAAIGPDEGEDDETEKSEGMEDDRGRMDGREWAVGEEGDGKVHWHYHKRAWPDPPPSYIANLGSGS